VRIASEGSSRHWPVGVDACRGERMATPRIGIALGSGSARGWAHIGVLRALRDAGIEPEVVSGTSIGAVVGAAYVSGQLARLEEWARSIGFFDIVGLMDVTRGRGGFIAGTRLLKAFRSIQTDVRIEDLPKPFAAVATDFITGREMWLQHGSLVDAVRASMSLPGLLPPFKIGEQWLLDGGLVNPVPVSACRALGADVVLAVNLNGDLTTRNVPAAALGRAAARRQAKPRSRRSARLAEQFRGTTSLLVSHLRGAKPPSPGFFEVLSGAIYIMQDRITRSRLAGDPPDVVFTPRLAHVRLLDFDRADEVIAEGHASVTAVLPALQRVLSLAQ
jgi:NTE family protein